MTLRADLSGVSKTLRSIGKKKADAKVTTTEALQKNGDIILAKSLTYVPVKSGALRASGKSVVTGVGNGALGTVAFGGPGIHYAVYVHENPLMRHTPPTTYRFLARAVLETKGTRAAMLKRLIGTTLTGGWRMSPAQLTLDLLRILGEVNGSTDWKGTYATLPDTVDKVVTVFDTDAQLDGRSMRFPNYEVYHHSGLMLHVRAKEYDVARGKATAVITALGRVVNRVETGVTPAALFLGFYRKNGPNYLGRTETNLRYTFSVNYTTIIEELA